MSNDIKSNIDKCIKACEDLLRELKQKKDQIAPFGKKLTFTIPSRRLYEVNVRIIENKFDDILDQILEYFSNISIYSNDIRDKGDSNKILRMFSPIHPIKNVDSKIRRLLTILHSLKTQDLYYNKVHMLKSTKQTVL